MKKIIFISVLFLITGCVHRAEEPNYIGVLPVYAVHQIKALRLPPPPPRVYVPFPPSLSIVIPARPNFIPHFPEESRKRLEMLLTHRK